MNDILADIAAYKREEIRAKKARTPHSAMAALARAASPPRGFRAALVEAFAPGRPSLIAEIKRASPSRGLIRSVFDPADLARAYAAGGATCLSVLTDGPSFAGEDAHLSAARRAVDLPCLRKEFLFDPWQVAESRALGADAVLVILALVDNSLAEELIGEANRWGMDVLVETHELDEARRANALGASIVGINNRSLRTFVTDLSVTESLAKEISETALLVTESGIHSAADAERMARAGARAMLVGESLMRQEDIEDATRRLVSFQRKET